MINRGRKGLKEQAITGQLQSSHYRWLSLEGMHSNGVQ
jgi:hypothetical protein